MSKTMENVKVVNSAVRTTLMVVILGALGYAGWFTYSNYIGPSRAAKQALKDLETLKAQYEEQSKELTLTKAENDRLHTSLRLLKVDQRLAHIEVTKVGESDEDGPYFDVRFVEVDEYENPISPSREFRLKGSKLYVDCWLCKFEDQYVEQADALRNASLCIFKRIYGDLDGLEGAHPLDREMPDGEMKAPGVYHRGAEMTEFEEKIWNDFWAIANDPDLQEEMGIRASHGQVNYVLAVEGQTYKAEVRASGGFALKPLIRKLHNSQEMTE